MEAKKVDIALKLLDSVIKLRPDYVEAWNRRATLHFANKDFGKSVADIRQVLAREPRHFGAWAGLGHIYMSTGDKKRAVEAYRRALAIHPHLSSVKTIVERSPGQCPLVEAAAQRFGNLSPRRGHRGR